MVRWGGARVPTLAVCLYFTMVALVHTTIVCGHFVSALGHHPTSPSRIALQTFGQQCECLHLHNAQTFELRLQFGLAAFALMLQPEKPFSERTGAGIPSPMLGNLYGTSSRTTPTSDSPTNVTFPTRSDHLKIKKRSWNSYGALALKRCASFNDFYVSSDVPSTCHTSQAMSKTDEELLDEDHGVGFPKIVVARNGLEGKLADSMITILTTCGVKEEADMLDIDPDVLINCCKINDQVTLIMASKAGKWLADDGHPNFVPAKPLSSSPRVAALGPSSSSPSRNTPSPKPVRESGHIRPNDLMVFSACEWNSFNVAPLLNHPQNLVLWDLISSIGIELLQCLSVWSAPSSSTVASHTCCSN